MILVVDSDANVREAISQSLTREGYSVKQFASAKEALEHSTPEPDLVLADALLPDMSGLLLLQEYRRRFPHRVTPFILLSTAPDSQAVVKAMEIGAEGLLEKPLNMDVLRAELRAVLVRRNRYATPTFYGDLSKISIPRILKFCARKALTGELVVSSSKRHARVVLRGGTVVPSDSADIVDFLGTLYELEEGTFVIHAHQLDFREIEQAAMPLSATGGELERPVGRLSALKLDQRQFQVQTELTSIPRDRIVTIVNLAGKIVVKRESLPPQAATKAEIEKLIETQHRAVEEEVRERVSPDVVRLIKDREYLADRFNKLYEAGCDRFKEKNFQTAYRNWSEAALIDRDDRALQLCLQIVRKKLGIPPPEKH